MPDGTPATPDVSAQVQDLVAKIFSGSNWRNEVERTVKRNLKLLAKNKELSAENETLKSKEPKDGQKLLTKEDAAIFDAFKALNLKPEDIKVLVKEHGEFKVKAEARDQEKDAEIAGKALGFENLPAFTRWLAKEGLHLEFKEETSRDETGTKTTKQVPYVRPKDNDKAAVQALGDYMEKEVPDFIDLFKQSPREADGDEPREGESDEEFVLRIQEDARHRVDSAPGVRIPATRSARTGNGVDRSRKALQDAEAEAEQNPMYTI